MKKPSSKIREEIARLQDQLKQAETREAERIGRQQLGELLRAIGLAELSDTDQLVGAPVQIKLKVREQEGYDPTNDVAGFKSVDGAKPVEAKQAQPAQSAKSAPWARK